MYTVQVRVVDMYLVEGPKLLYRLALSALKLYAAHTQAAGQHTLCTVCGFSLTSCIHSTCSSGGDKYSRGRTAVHKQHVHRPKGTVVPGCLCHYPLLMEHSAQTVVHISD